MPFFETAEAENMPLEEWRRVGDAQEYVRALFRPLGDSWRLWGDSPGAWCDYWAEVKADLTQGGEDGRFSRPLDWAQEEAEARDAWEEHQLRYTVGPLKRLTGRLSFYIQSDSGSIGVDVVSAKPTKVPVSKEDVQKAVEHEVGRLALAAAATIAPATDLGR